MHQLLREMGREIIRQESRKQPGKRSRLWYHEDVFNVLRDKTVRIMLLISISMPFYIFVTYLFLIRELKQLNALASTWMI